jgi:ABC-type glycerol-3-phosphate transport system substrate-binding protein
MTLTWWTPEFLSPSAAQPSGPLLEEYLAGFRSASDDKIVVTPIRKAKYGKGGLLDSLRTAQPVASTVLPDIVTLDLDELEQAASLGLLRPLDGLVDEQVVAGLYPPARAAGQFGGQLMAVPLALDLEHAVYDRRSIDRAPETWAGLLSGKIPYLFPAASPQPASAVNPMANVQRGILSDYLSAGGLLDPETRELTLQEQPLLRLLTFYADATSAGLLPVRAGEISNLDESWAGYVQNAVPMATANARRYLAERGALPDSGSAAPPGWSAPDASVVGGWALAIVTSDPERQKAAAAFINWLLASERAGSWAQKVGWLPASPEALSTWGDDAYYEFLDQQLQAAVAPPIGSGSAQAALRIQQAVLDVLAGTSRPEEAARAAITPAKQ